MKFGKVFSEFTPDGAFHLLGDDEAHPVDGRREPRPVGADQDGVVLRHHPAPVQEFALEDAADQGHRAHLEEDVLSAQGEGSGVVGLAENLFELLECRRGHHEFDVPVEAFLGVKPPKRQAEAVHGHHGHVVGLHLNEAARLHRPRHVLAHREDGARDHLPQLILGDLDGVFIFHVGKLRVVLGAHGRDGKGRDAALDEDLILAVHRDGDLVVGELADDIKEEPGGHDARAGLGDVGGDGDGDAGL